MITALMITFFLNIRVCPLSKPCPTTHSNSHTLSLSTMPLHYTQYTAPVITCLLPSAPQLLVPPHGASAAGTTCSSQRQTGILSDTIMHSALVEDIGGLSGHSHIIILLCVHVCLFHWLCDTMSSTCTFVLFVIALHSCISCLY